MKKELIYKKMNYKEKQLEYELKIWKKIREENNILRRMKLQPIEKLILLEFHSLINNELNSFDYTDKITFKKISQNLNIPAENVCDSIKLLKKNGYIDIMSHGEDYNVSSYRILPKCFIDRKK